MPIIVGNSCVSDAFILNQSHISLFRAAKKWTNTYESLIATDWSCYTKGVMLCILKEKNLNHLREGQEYGLWNSSLYRNKEPQYK